MKKQATCGVLVAALLMCAPGRAVMVVDADGKPIRPGTGRGVVIGEGPDGGCKAPPRNRPVAFNLAPETRLVDAIAWISSIICKPFVVRDTTVAQDRRLTMVAPERMTPTEAYRLFAGALDSLGLTIELAGKYLRIVETDIGYLRLLKEGTVLIRGAAPEPYVTALVRWRELSPEQKRWLLKPRSGESCDCNFLVPDTLVITEVRSDIERLLGRPIK